MKKIIKVLIFIILCILCVFSFFACNENQKHNYIAHKHNYIAIITAPNCTEKGYTAYTCECGDNYKDDYVNALGHKPGIAVEENIQEPKCNVKGGYDLVVDCKVCGKELSREHKEIAALEHEFTDYVSDNNATYNSDGTKTAYCNRGCGAINVITDLGSKLIAVKKLELNNLELYLVEGETDNIIATISPNNATDKNIEWHSSNSEIAEVNNGKITAIGRGNTTITAISSNGKVATCQVFICPNSFTYTVSEGKATITGFNDNLATVVVIPKSYNTFPVTAIKSGVFRNKTMIRTVVIRENITILSNGLFYGCNSLEKVKLPNTITNIEGFAFNGCTSLNEIILPSSLQKIGEHAFGNCKNLTKIIIPRSVKYIEKSILWGCDKNLITVTFEETSGWFYHTPQPPYPEVSEKQFQGVVWFLFEHDNYEYMYRW